MSRRDSFSRAKSRVKQISQPMVIIQQSAAKNTAEASDLDSGERVDRARYMYLAFAEIE